MLEYAMNEICILVEMWDGWRGMGGGWMGRVEAFTEGRAKLSAWTIGRLAMIRKLVVS